MDLSPEKILLVGLIALMVLGPERLPHAARTAGKMLAELRRLSASVQHEVTNAIAEPRDALGQAAAEFGIADVRNTLGTARSSLRGALNEVVNGAAGQGAEPGTARPVLGADPEASPLAPGPGIARAAFGADPEASALAPGPGVAVAVPAVLRVPVGSSMAAPDDPSLN
jgi:Tat protein translocase TatB subunit